MERPEHSAPKARVVLALMPTPLRLHVRRLLSQHREIAVVGQAFSGSLVQETLANTGGNWLIIDASASLSELPDLKHYGDSLLGCLILHAGNRADLPPLRHPKIEWLPRPHDLEMEVAEGAFGQAVIRKILGLKTQSYLSEQRPADVGSPSSQRPVTAAKRGGKYDVLAIGSSTGGPQALHVFLAAIATRLTLPVVITQHISQGFTASLARSLQETCKIEVHEAHDGQALSAGEVYLAPAGKHLRIERQGPTLLCRLDDGPPECFCKPSVDVMLRSLAEITALHTLVVILTGMGQDGLLGATHIKACGGSIFAQDEASSVVWGMPGAVAKADLCTAVLPLHQLGDAVIDVLRRHS